MKMLLVAATLLVSSTAVYAARTGQGQKFSPCDGSGGWGAECAYNKVFVVNNMTRLAGEIVSVDTFVPQTKMTEGVAVKVKTGTEVSTVHLGPKWFIDNQDVRLAPADQIEVRGSKIVFNGKPTIVAAEVIKGSESLNLRDDQGRPVWSGWRQKGRP